VDNFIKHFRREAAGVWLCMSPGEIQLPQGRLQVTAGSRFTRGMKFMNVELAALLDEQYDRDKKKT
jgi:hypothetical protein